MADEGNLTRSLVKVRQAIRQLTATVTKQAQHIAGLTATVTMGASQIERATVDLSPLAIGTQDVTITWVNPFPDTAYIVLPTTPSGLAGLGTVSTVLKTKDVDGCVVTVKSLAVVAVAFLDVVAIRA